MVSMRGLVGAVGMGMTLALAVVVAGTSTGAQAAPGTTSSAGIVSLSEMADPGGLGTSARVAGMGGAFVALADDGASVFYNPAGLAFLEGPEIQGAYASGPAGTPGGQPATRVGGLVATRHVGLGATRLAVPGEGGDLESWDATAAVAARMWVVGLGVSGHYLASAMGGADQERGWSADAGVLVSAGPLRVGAVMRNAAGSLTGADQTQRDVSGMRQVAYGAALRLGFANLAADYVQPPSGWGEDAPAVVRAGAEIRLGPIALRAGGSRPQREDSSFPFLKERRTVGASLQLGGLRLDYAASEPWNDGDPLWGAHPQDRVQSLGLRAAF
ncbi:hypothetical protein U7230_13985 [Carboxydochorda subterranea]|uniref:Uncharacterized protein n=1 Tax=Carboxydichorda subterranea TaxID=3109565 RepID=A0ABZ1BX29_9FIRM|nr:hypothetical protein [Limnochorda sp. L945t]WRP17175.1 hypothetical protein U7230_13985 [Limnochorda sp. L945t]